MTCRTRLIGPLVLAALGLLMNGGLFAGPAVIVFTADTEGHAGPCTECPGHSGLGGLARRATAVSKLRGQAPVLLLDAGNALYGPDSIAGNGGVIVRAYNALAYDAVNLTPRDFRLGKPAVTDALKEAKFAAVSANLLDVDTGQPLVRPYVVKETGGRRVAVLGLSEQPAGMEYLPHLKRQLAGVRIVPPAEALAQWLPKAKAQADDVVVLYYGSATGAKKIADSFGNGLAAILVGGARPEELPQTSGVPLVATSDHGKAVARLTLGAAGGAAEQVAIDDATEADPKMAALLAAAQPSASLATAAAEPKAEPDGGEPGEGPVRRLVPVKVQPLEPVAAEPAQSPPLEPVESAQSKDSAPDSAEAVAPAASQPVAGAGAWEFLKSLVARPKRKAETSQPTPRTTSEPAPTAEEPVAEPPEAPPVKEAAAPQQPKKAAAAPSSTGPRFCTHCGAKLPPNAKFCTNCGTRVRR